jgi:hypothetical protein
VRAIVIALLCVGALLGQSQTNTMSGSCDQIINDNRGVITITCSGVDKNLMEQLRKTADVLDRVARRQTDPAISRYRTTSYDYPAIAAKSLGNTQSLRMAVPWSLTRRTEFAIDARFDPAWPDFARIQ